MSSYPLGEELAGVVQKRRASMTLQDQVAQLFEEARDDVISVFAEFGAVPSAKRRRRPRRFFYGCTPLSRRAKTFKIRRGWIFRVAHNLGLKIRARRKLSNALRSRPGVATGRFGARPEQNLLEREQTLRFHKAVETTVRAATPLSAAAPSKACGIPEIGSVLGISPSAVGEFLRRAISRIGRRMEYYEGVLTHSPPRRRAAAALSRR